MRRRLPGGERLAHAADAAGHVRAQTVVLARVDADHKAGHTLCQMHQLVQHVPQLQNVVDLLAHNVAARDVGVVGHGAERPQVLGEIIVRRHGVAHDGQRRAPHRGEKPQRHARLAPHRGQHLVDLAQNARRIIRLAEPRVGDLRVVDALPPVAAGDPEELILKERVVRIIRVLPVGEHLPQNRCDVRVREREVRRDRNRAIRSDAFCEHISVKIDLLQIRKHRLPVLRHGERDADLRDVIGRVPGVL